MTLDQLPPRHPLARFDDAFWIRMWSGVSYDEGGCWLWVRSLGSHGYGQISAKVDGKYQPLTTHRLVCEYFSGPLGAMQALHECDTKPCCRFGGSHLYVGTPQQNIHDSMSRGQWWCIPRKSHCSRGHAYSEYQGRQVCWICRSRKGNEASL